jgi:hypothetical protein
VLYHRIAATGGFFVAEILGVMWPAIQKPKTLKELQKEIPSRSASRNGGGRRGL